MDGMLSEWERMLPDPEEIDDLDHSDLLDNDIPSIFGGKNQSPSILETANIDEIRTGEITRRLTNTTEEEKCEGEPTDLKLEEDSGTCKKTVELIDELNRNLNKKAPSLENSTAMISIKKSGKLGDDKTSSGAINSNPNDGKIENRFQTCMDSPLQISDVRTIDLPTEKDRVNTMSQSNRKSSMASEMSQTPLFDEKGESFDDEANDAENDITKIDQANKTMVTEEKEHIADENPDYPEFASPDLNTFSADSNTADSSYGSSNLNNDASSGNDNEREASSESTILLAIKEEPMDYEEYGKTPEFDSWQMQANNGEANDYISNFYNDVDCENKEEYETNYPKDYRITENGLYQCVYCSSKLSKYEQLKNHVRDRHSTKYQCKQCDQSFYRSQDLAIHCRLVHAPEGQVFGRKSNVNKSGKMIIKKKKCKAIYDDDGNQIYKCAYCGKIFHIQQAMASHVRNEHHYNFKKKETLGKYGGINTIYTCIYCDLTFNKKKELSKHTRVDHPEHFKGKRRANVLYDDYGRQIYSCGYCDKTFLIQQAMASHVKNAHCTTAYTKEKDKSKTRKEKDEKEDQILINKGDLSETIDKIFSKLEDSDEKDSKSEELTKMDRESEEPSEICKNDEELDNIKSENEVKSKSREFSKRTLPYKNILFEHDTSQIEENLTNSECSLKRELKSSQIYHCSKCRKWFYREKQALNHEQTCTFIKQEQTTPEKTEPDIVEENEVEDKHVNRQTYLKQQKEIREKVAIENKIQSDIVKKLREKMMAKRKKMAAFQINKRQNEDVEKKSSLNALPRFCCRYCPSSHEEGKSMNVHLLKHLGEVRRTDANYRCRICKKPFPHGKKMLYHLQQHTSLDIVNLYKQQSIPECKVCGQPFVNLQFLQKHEKTHGLEHVEKEKSHVDYVDKREVVKPSLDSVIKSGITNSAITFPNYISGNISSQQRGSNSTVLNMGQKSTDGVFSSNHVEVKKRSVNLDDIPFQCGMCLSRFPTSQYLLHHITIHMQGPYVFSVAVDKKGGKGSEKIIGTPHPSPGIISFAGRSYSDPTDIQADCNVRIVKPAAGNSTSETSTGTSTASSTGNLAVSKATTTIEAIANDHMYTTSILPKSLKSLKSNAKENDESWFDDSATESAASSDDESSAYYDTDDDIQMKNFTNAEKTANKRKNSVKKEVAIPRVGNFKRCFDIAGGVWFECPYCLNMSENQRDFDVHMLKNCQASSKKKMAQCGICDRKFVSKWHLSKHMEHSHKHNSYRCSFCGKGFASSLYIIKHMQQEHH